MPIPSRPALRAYHRSRLGHLALQYMPLKQWHQDGPCRQRFASSLRSRKHGINLVLRGSGWIRSGGRSLPLRAPCAVLRPPQTAMTWIRQPGDWREGWMMLSGPLGELLALGGCAPPARAVTVHHLSAASLERLALLERQMTSGSWPEVLAALQCVAAAVWSGCGESVDDDPVRQQLRAAVHADPARVWRLSDLAKLCGRSAEALRKYIHRRHGCGPMALITEMRMQLACERLPRQLIKQVAAELGYRDYRSFSRQFARHYGVSPRSYRQQAASTGAT